MTDPVPLIMSGDSAQVDYGPFIPGPILVILRDNTNSNVIQYPREEVHTLNIITHLYEAGGTKLGWNLPFLCATR